MKLKSQLDEFDSLGDDHVGTSTNTPLRPDAFALSNDEKIETYKQQLKLALDKQGITYTNRFYFLGYNAPYEFFNRKNEVIVELPKEIVDLQIN